ncbi:von Willebrand factor A domain-containing protein 5A-like [Rana temporaria]|uniref:von Willebrand factor A domain-containing protein 5A-like n=1 Tax=Rana temporaria TaxID=8407 RepID=UPI001AADA2B4|nr:von Willebrand factor A domain-containing protein 5A-like [Rana temporaria]
MSTHTYGSSSDDQNVYGVHSYKDCLQFPMPGSRSWLLRPPETHRKYSSHDSDDQNKGSEKPPRSAARGVFPDLMRLIPLQNADGSWDLTPEISDVLGISETDIKARNPDQVRIGQSLEERIETLKKIIASVNVEGSVWVTVLAVIWLHTNYLDQREEWELLERKAVSWVRAKAGSSLGEFVRSGNELLKSSVDPEVFGL